MNKKFVLSFAAILAGSLFIYNGVNGNGALAQKKSSEKPRIDLAFCIDTTGSMQSEIDTVKAKTKEIVAKLSGSKPAPDVRVGLVAFRDRGDEYVTKVFQFNNDIDQVVKDISSLKANGGGDGPEAVNQALHSAVNELKWSSDKKTVKMLFLIGDAEPHYYPDDYKWADESKAAIARGIQINTIACQGLHSSGSGIEVFQKIAKLADGTCEDLTYRQEIVDARGEKTTLLSAGGKTYKLAPGASASWREGAAALASRGAAAPAPVSADASEAFSSALPYAGGYSASSARAAAPMPMHAGRSAAPSRAFRSRLNSLDSVSAPSPAGFGGSGAGGAGSYGAVSRSESNLSDIVLKKTKEAAMKKANIEYKD